MSHEISGTRVHSLDWIRGLASLAVCWHHITTYHFGATLNSDVLTLFRASGKYGWLGVPAFFAVSGFVIPYSLHRGNYQLRSYGTFLLKRVIRLDPPYLCSVLLALGIGWAYASWKGLPYPWDTLGLTLHLGYLNALAGREWINPVFWTLGIEMQYYLSIALLFPLLFARRQWVRRLSVAMGLAFYLALPECGLLMTPQRFIFPYIPIFLMGIVTCQHYLRVIAAREFFLSLGLITLCSFLKLDHLSTSVGLAASLMIIARARPARASRFLGNVSYSLYLVHYPLCTLMLSLLGITVLGASVSGKLLSGLCALAFGLLSAWLLYRLVERPSQRLSSSFLYRPYRKSAIAVTEENRHQLSKRHLSTTAHGGERDC